MPGLPDLSQLCVGHAPVPTAGKNYKSKNVYMQKTRVNLDIVHRRRWHPFPQSASALIELKGKVFKAFDEESQGPNLYSMAKLLPILMEMGMAMAMYSKILPKLVRALVQTEIGLGLVRTQKDTREIQALNILRTRYEHSNTCPAELCGPLEGPQFRNQLQQVMQQTIPDRATYDKWYGLVTG